MGAEPEFYYGSGGKNSYFAIKAFDNDVSTDDDGILGITVAGNSLSDDDECWIAYRRNTGNGTLNISNYNNDINYYGSRHNFHPDWINRSETDYVYIDASSSLNNKIFSTDALEVMAETTMIFETTSTSSADGFVFRNSINPSSITPGCKVTFETDRTELANGDLLVEMNFDGLSFTDNMRHFAQIKTFVIDATDTAEDGKVEIHTMTAGSVVKNSTFEGTNLTVQGSVTQLSDIRTKENVETVENGLDLVSQLRGVWYNKIGEEDRNVGVIAQEVEEVLPEVVKTDNDGMKSVDYGKMVGVLIEAIKDLKAEIEELKSGK